MPQAANAPLPVCHRHRPSAAATASAWGLERNRHHPCPTRQWIAEQLKWTRCSTAGSRYCVHHSSDVGLVCGAIAEGSGLSLDGGVTFVCPQDEEEALELRMQREAEEEAMNGPRLAGDESE